jgi:hypothetical protein
MPKRNITLAVIVTVLVVAVSGYFYLNSVLTKYFSPTTSSESIELGDVTSDKVYLNIFSPVDGEILKSAKVTVKGKTNVHGEVFVNDKDTRGDIDGYFSVDLTLDEGKNEIVVIANDEFGNVTEKSFSVSVQTF